METKLEPLPESTNKEYWGDGMTSRHEVKGMKHQHHLFMRNRGLECSCGWRIAVSDPITAEKLMNRFNNN